MKKLVVKVNLHAEKDRSKAMQVVSGFGGIGSVSVDSKDNKLTVTGDFDPVKVVNKLRKSWYADVVSIEPAKEDDGKKDEGKKEEGKKNEVQVADLVKVEYPPPYYPMMVTYHYVPPEENVGCVIC